MRFGADIGGFMSGIRTATGALGSFGAAVVAAGAITGALAIILGTVAVKSAGDFQQGLNRLVTGAGDVTDNMKVMGQGILNVSTATGILTSGTSGLNAAMYLVISSGQRGAQALDTLKAAAQGAQIEQANMVAVTQILTTLQTNFGLHTYTATQYMNGLVAAVAHGKISLEDLSTAMSPILPNAHQLGIHFADVAAAMSDMTNQGIPAAQAATALRFVMQSMILPTHASQVAMREWGLDTNKVAAEMKVSLPGAIQMYIDAAKRAGPEGSKPFIDALAEMMGGGQRAAKAIFALSQSMGAWKTDIAAINTALGLNSSAVMGWETVQSSFNIKVEQGRAMIAALGIVVGTALLPEITRLMGLLQPLMASFIQWVIQSHVVENAMHTLDAAIGQVISIGTSIVAFFKNSELAMAGLKGVAVAVAVILGGLLVAAFYSLAVAAGAAAVAVIAATWPFLLIGAAIAVVVAAFIHFYNTSATFRGIVDQIIGVLQRLWASIMGQVGPAITWLGGAVAWLAGAWHTIVAALAPVFPVFTYIWSIIAGSLLPIMRQLWAFIVADFVPVWQQLVSTWRSQFLPLLAQLWSGLQRFAPLLQLLGMALLLVAGIVLGVVVVAFVVLLAVFAGLARGLAGMLSGLITAFQGIVQIVTGVLQVLGGIIGFFTDLVTGKFDKLGADLGMIWAGIVNIFMGAWTLIAGIFNAAVFLVTGIVSGFVDALIGFFTALAHAIVGGSIIPDMCNAIVSTFTGMISSVISLVLGFIVQAISLFISLGVNIVMAVTNAKNQAIATFNTLKSQAIGVVQSLVSSVGSILNTLAGIGATAAQGLINGLVGGLNAGIGAVGGAINNIVGFISSHLPKSPAKVGPLRDLDKFGPALTGGFAAGIIKGAPEVHAAVNMMLQPFHSPLTSNVGVNAGYATQQSSSTQGNSRPIIIQVGNREYRAFVDNLGNDLVGSSTVRVHFAGGR